VAHKFWYVVYLVFWSLKYYLTSLWFLLLIYWLIFCDFPVFLLLLIVHLLLAGKDNALCDNCLYKSVEILRPNICSVSGNVFVILQRTVFCYCWIECFVCLIDLVGLLCSSTPLFSYPLYGCLHYWEFYYRIAHISVSVTFCFICFNGLLLVM
jgi:hypothetical protein